MTPDERADAVGKAAAVAAAAGVVVSGAYRVGTLSMAVANTSGTEQYYDATDAYLSVFATDDDGISGSAADYAIDIGDIDAEALTRVAVGEVQGRREPGRHRCRQLRRHPGASRDGVRSWSGSTSRPSAPSRSRRGMSFMAGRIGEKVMGDARDHLRRRDGPGGSPDPVRFRGRAEEEGHHHRERHRARSRSTTRPPRPRTACESTGHAGLAVFRGGPVRVTCSSARATPSSRTCCRPVKRGLLVSRFHYVNGLLDTKKALFTGMTRDGTFLIEDGKITKAVKNLRFTDSMLRAFSNVEADDEEARRRAGATGAASGSITAPCCAYPGFQIHGRYRFLVSYRVRARGPSTRACSSHNLSATHRANGCRYEGSFEREEGASCTRISRRSASGSNARADSSVLFCRRSTRSSSGRATWSSGC